MTLRFYVRATVTTTVEADDQLSAMQALCDRLHPAVLAREFDVNTIDAKRVVETEAQAQS